MPGVDVPGVYVSETDVLRGPVHAPVFCGVPVNLLIKANGAALLQIGAVAEVPALDKLLTETVTVALEPPCV